MPSVNHVDRVTAKPVVSSIGTGGHSSRATQRNALWACLDRLQYQSTIDETDRLQLSKLLPITWQEGCEINFQLGPWFFRTTASRLRGLLIVGQEVGITAIGLDLPSRLTFQAIRPKLLKRFLVTAAVSGYWDGLPISLTRCEVQVDLPIDIDEQTDEDVNSSADELRVRLPSKLTEIELPDSLTIRFVSQLAESSSDPNLIQIEFKRSSDPQIVPQAIVRFPSVEPTSSLTVSVPRTLLSHYLESVMMVYSQLEPLTIRPVDLATAIEVTGSEEFYERVAQQVPPQSVRKWQPAESTKRFELRAVGKDASLSTTTQALASFGSGPLSLTKLFQVLNLAEQHGNGQLRFGRKGISILGIPRGSLAAVEAQLSRLIPTPAAPAASATFGTAVVSNSPTATIAATSAITTAATTSAVNSHEKAQEADAAEDFPWHDPGLAIDERLKLSSGRPLKRRLMSAMAQLNCGACGYLCQTYSEAIAAGAETCLDLCAPGGSETSAALADILAKENCAVENDSSEALPAPQVLAVKAPSDRSTSSVKHDSVSHDPLSLGHHRNHPFTARLIESLRLTDTSSEKAIHQIRIDLSGSSIQYRAGDALGIWPVNDERLVAQVIEALGANGDEIVSVGNQSSVPLRRALRESLCLKSASVNLLKYCFNHAADSSQAASLNDLIEQPSLRDGKDVLDALQLTGQCGHDLKAFVSALGSLQPRLYSISSSQRKYPNEVHLTVGRVAWHDNERTRLGVASTLLCDRLQPGDALRIFHHASKHFTVPADPAAPLIMIGPGTGIAPFIGFLQDREATSACGKNWLFFGAPHERTDFLYRENLHAWQASGLLTRLDLAFSRDQAKRTYVQDRMRQHADELYRWIEVGATIAVCGDAKRMAVDVDQALRDIIAQHSGRDSQQAQAYLRELSKSGRTSKMCIRSRRQAQASGVRIQDYGLLLTSSVLRSIHGSVTRRVLGLCGLANPNAHALVGQRSAHRRRLHQVQP